ncbi:tetratricopeptide repeat protein [Paracoccaceae bacterium]|nr:tetratricopeptide repeat protein [Paracoccaceae bacterium]
MAKPSVDQALLRAKSHVKAGEIVEAQKLYHSVLQAFPKNKRAQKGLTALSKLKQPAATQGPPQDTINQLINLYNQGQLAAVVEQAQALREQYPETFIIWNILGVAQKGLGRVQAACEAFENVTKLNPTYADGFNNLGVTLKDQGKLEEAIEAYNKALAIKPDYAEACNNMGIAIQEQGKLEEAIEAYNKALAIKPDYTGAYYNMGAALQEQGKLEEAIEAYNKALAIKPDYAEAFYNMGTALKEQGKLNEAIEAYNKALAIKPNYAEVTENSFILAVQLLPIIANYRYDCHNSITQVNSEVAHRPKYQVQNLIKTFLEANFTKARSYNKNLNACDRKLLSRLKPKDRVFCNAYSIFIGRLLDSNLAEEPACENKVYHLGESHSLSYAHRNITIEGSNFRIIPRITFGAKAFHFSRTKYDSFKAITKAHFLSLPKSSKVFLSYGEIDCRPNEGFISAATKLEKPLEELIDHTTEGYVQWFLNQNANQRHHLYFINVPAPVYNKEHSADLNSEVARTVALFNTALKKCSLQHGFDILDVFKFTAGDEGFSNGLFHVDNIHLGAKALPEIEQQLS